MKIMAPVLKLQTHLSITHISLTGFRLDRQQALCDVIIEYMVQRFTTNVSIFDRESVGQSIIDKHQLIIMIQQEDVVLDAVAYRVEQRCARFEPLLRFLQAQAGRMTPYRDEAHCNDKHGK